MIFRKSLLVTFIFGLSLLVSCSSKVEDQNEQVNNATYDMGQITGSALLESNILGWNDLPNTNTITFKACVLENDVVQSVVGEVFNITTSLGTITPAPRTDINGCLTWTETFDVSYLAKERYFKHRIVFDGLGHIKGKKQIDIAINPWKADTHVLKDLRYEKRLAHIDGSFQKGMLLAGNDTNLILQGVQLKKVRVTPNRVNKSSDYEYDFIMSPGFIRQKLDGSNYPFQGFSQGKFKVEFLLIEKNTEENDLFLGNSEQTVDINLQKKLKGNFSLSVTRKIEPESRVYMAIKITPVEGPNGLNATEGLVLMNGFESNSNTTLNNLDEMTSLKFAALTKQLKSFSDEANIAHPKKNQDNEGPNTLNESEDNFGFSIKPLSIWAGSQLSDETYNKSSKRKMYTRMKICMTEAASIGSAKAVKNGNKFRITAYDSDNNLDTPNARVHETFDGCIDKTYAITAFDIYNAEHWIPMKIKIEGLNGNYRGITRIRNICVNPWTGSADYGFDLGNSGQECPKVSNPKMPSILLPSVGYQYLRMDTDSFQVNKFMHMAHKRKFSFRLTPKVSVKFRSENGNNSLPNITFGDYKVRFTIYVPNKAEVDYDEPDLSEFTLLTAAEQIMKVKENGVTHGTVSIPFTVLDVQKLPFKNLLVVEMSSNDKNSLLKPTKVSIPFYGLASSMAAIDANLLPAQKEDPERIAEINEIIKHKEKLLTSLNQKLDDKDMTNVNLYRDSIKKIFDAKHKGINYLHTDIKSLNEIEMKGGKGYINSMKVRNPNNGILMKREVSEYSVIDHWEFRRIADQGGNIPNHILNKFCRHIYNTPAVSSKLNGDLKIRSGEDFINCYNNPYEVLEIVPLVHTEKILSTKKLPGMETRVPKAKYVIDEAGTLDRGQAFFAAEGDRHAQSEGERKSKAWEMTIGGSANPPPFLGGGGISYTEQQVTYKGKVDAHIEANYGRYYTQLNTNHLTVDRLELEFSAKVYKCVSVVSRVHYNRHLHICDTKPQIKKMRENWYFIGEDLSKQNRTLSNGTDVSDSSLLQIIRGKTNFMRQWAKWESEDTLYVIRNMDKRITIGKGFEKLNQEGVIHLPYEGYSDNAFPGVITPEY